MTIDADTVRAAALGAWPGILHRLGIEGLSRSHGPCPGCGGRDRFRFDDKEGRGSWVCGGGGELRAGDGFALIEHVLGVDFPTALGMVASALGIREGDAPRMPPRMPPRAPSRPMEPSRTQARALALWDSADRSDAAVTGHPYAKRKGITSAGGAGRATAWNPNARAEQDCLVIPVRTLDGELVAVECINPEGSKWAYGPKSQGLLILGNDMDKSLPWYVTEGWASGWSAVFDWHKGHACCAVAFGKARLDDVAREVAGFYAPKAIRVIREPEVPT